MSAVEIGGPARRVGIWDGPTRIFHWLLVLAIPALWWTAENGEIGLHVTLGIGVTALLVFRILWGLIGSSTARFGNFLKGPRAVMSYLNGNAVEGVGHNPIGGWSVAAMLLVLVAQVGLGLFAESDDTGLLGPLSTMVSPDAAARITDLHGLLFNVLIGLIVLHVAAILFYAIARRRNLVGPMITGSGAASADAASLKKASTIRLAIALVVSVVAFLWLWSRL